MGPTSPLRYVLLPLLPFLLIPQQPSHESRLELLERRVAALERAVPPAPPVRLWNEAEATALQLAVDAMVKGPASLFTLTNENGGPSKVLLESKREVVDDASFASALLTKAQSAALKRGPLRASELCEEALAHYNRAAKALGLSEHKR